MHITIIIMHITITIMHTTIIHHTHNTPYTKVCVLTQTSHDPHNLHPTGPPTNVVVHLGCCSLP